LRGGGRGRGWGKIGEEGRKGEDDAEG